MSKPSSLAANSANVSAISFGLCFFSNADFVFPVRYRANGFCCSRAFQFKLRETESKYSVFSSLTVGNGYELACRLQTRSML